MYVSSSKKHKVTGFGATQEEAVADCQMYIARACIEDDVTDIYKRRREELHAWLPLPNLLSIKGVACLKYEDGFITNLKTGEQIYCTPYPYAQYLYLYPLLGHDLSFTDFTIAVKREIDIFLNNISTTYGKLDDFPQIKPGDLMKAVSVEHLNQACFYARTNTQGELLVCNGSQVVSVEMGEEVHESCILAYAFSKLGLIYDGRKITPC